jgi:uncharacterized protein (TIGR02996 family)
MNDDESFIRAIVDSPGDEAPRLVYADWLEERGDPRGPYLRAERDWAKDRKPAELKKLHRLAKPLDPVWVAQVSRPPVGVCLEAPLFRRAKKLTSESAIQSEEGAFGVKFPPEYRAFLLNYNGGGFLYPSPKEGGKLDESAFTDVFSGVGLGEDTVPPDLAAFADSVFEGGNGINNESPLFPIGAPDQERTVYLLGVNRLGVRSKPYLGQVYVAEEPWESWDSWLEGGLGFPRAARSFPELLAKLAIQKGRH